MGLELCFTISARKMLFCGGCVPDNHYNHPLATSAAEVRDFAIKRCTGRSCLYFMFAAHLLHIKSILAPYVFRDDAKGLWRPIRLKVNCCYIVGEKL